MTYPTLLLAGLGLSILFVAQYIVAYLSSPLKKIPGPFLAKFSDIWRFWSQYQTTQIETFQGLHEKYGSAVRVGPNTVSLSDPSLIKTIYNTRGTFIKSDYYTINDALQNGHIIQNIFSTLSNEFHSRALKPVQKLYSYNDAVKLGPLMDDTIRAFCSELEHRFILADNAGKTCDIADWLSYFAWDFLGDMTFSKRMGFMEQGRDVDGMIDTAEKVMRYFGMVGQLHKLDKLLGKNPYLPYKFPDFAIPAGFCVNRFMERMQKLDQYKDKNDFMNGFLKAKEEYPDLVSDNEIIGYLILNILGGADTTAILLKAITYHILRTPHVKKRLQQELRIALLPTPPPYPEISHLTYLDACIKEGLRIHPVVGHLLERIVPSSGLTLEDGTVLPPGTIVGINPWVLSRNKYIYGEKPDEFRPERWLQGERETEREWEDRVKRMQAADLSFGAGNRTCLGRPLALVELYKVIGTLFARYEIELEDPTREWELHPQWFVWPHNIKVKMSLYQP